jgi:hypothetical protein
VSIYDDIIEAARKVQELPPYPAKLECGERVLATLRALAEWDNRHRPQAPWSPAPPQLPIELTGVPVYPLPDMRPDAWRFLDQDGEVMAEGEMP